MTKILVVNGRSYAKAVEGLGEITFDPSELLEEDHEIKLVLFTGGEDITPSYYGDRSPQNLCYFNELRDRVEKEIFDLARIQKIRCIGICRGVQFLNVMAGGRMIHDVNYHSGGYHDMTTSTGDQIRVNSLHHQMIVIPEDAHLIAWSTKRLANRYYGRNDEREDGPKLEPEAALFPSIECAGAQYHPEMMPKDSPGYMWFHELADSLIQDHDFSDIVNKYTEKPCTNQNTLLQRF